MAGYEMEAAGARGNAAGAGTAAGRAGRADARVAGRRAVGAAPFSFRRRRTLIIPSQSNYHPNSKPNCDYH